jgi:predicted RNase H-like nuclease (RuvC/YqgF family)
MDEVFAQLEEKVDRLSARVRDLAGENARLKGAIIETAAERDRLKKEVEDGRELAALQGGEASAKVARYEEERKSVRTRIERLIKSLEESTEQATPAE